MTFLSCLLSEQVICHFHYSRYKVPCGKSIFFLLHTSQLPQTPSAFWLWNEAVRIRHNSVSATALSKGVNECYTSLGNPILGQGKCLYTKQRRCFVQSISYARGREVLIVEQSSYRKFSEHFFRNINLPSLQVTNHFLHLLTGWNLTLKDNPLQDPDWLQYVKLPPPGTEPAHTSRWDHSQCFHWYWLLIFHQRVQLNIKTQAPMGKRSRNIFILYLSSNPRKGNTLEFSWYIVFLKCILENH